MSVFGELYHENFLYSTILDIFFKASSIISKVYIFRQSVLNRSTANSILRPIYLKSPLISAYKSLVEQYLQSYQNHAIPRQFLQLVSLVLLLLQYLDGYDHIFFCTIKEHIVSVNGCRISRDSSVPSFSRPSFYSHSARPRKVVDNRIIINHPHLLSI